MPDQPDQQSRDQLDKLKPSAEEWNVLWRYHDEQETVCAGKRQYSDAAAHKKRKDEIEAHSSWGRGNWERGYVEAAERENARG